MSSRSSPTCLFVYGTLRHGCGNRHARLLDRSAAYLGTAQVQGAIFRLHGYPGMIVGGSDWVVGDLFALPDPATLAELDQYEGPAEFHRVETMALLPSGEEAACWVYEYLGSVKEQDRIVSGDWMSG